MRGQTHDKVIYSTYHQNPVKGSATTRGRNLPFPITSAFTAACTTIQAVITALLYRFIWLSFHRINLAWADSHKTESLRIN